MLTEEQELDLSRYIAEDFGMMLDEVEFIDYCLQLLEDIAGFECFNDKQIQSITTRIWRKYVEQSKPII